MLRRSLLASAILVMSFGCHRDSGHGEASELRAPSSPVVHAAPAQAAREPVRMEEVPVPHDLDAYVLRGGQGGDDRLRIVFVPGMCVHPLGYAQAFQFAAAEHGDMIAVQGDTSCGGDGAARRWTSDLATMDKRIDAALAAAKLEPAKEITLVGYSQGAERAERLAARYPEKYTRVVLMASPITPSVERLRHARAAVMMAGTYDIAHGKMKRSVEPLRRAGVPSTFVEIPGARHGSMGETPEPTMDEALDFIASAD